jgi:hypothetical protein
MQQLKRYWGTDCDWRKFEARLNALPQFMTTIDGDWQPAGPLTGRFAIASMTPIVSL